MRLIEESYPWSDSGLVAIDHDEEEQLQKLLLGHSVKKINNDHLELDDGTVLRIIPNQGSCACDSGDYELTDLNEADNIITSVSVETTTKHADDFDAAYTYRVFVVAGDKRINLFTVDGDDGNGYYGTGYVILVRALPT